MRRLLLLGVLALPVFAQPNFGGSWMLNAAKSDYGPVPAPQVMMRTIDHQGATLKMSTFQKGVQGEVTSELRYTTDGKVAVNGESTGAARWDGEKLVIESTRKVQANELKSREVWTLSGDGKTLTVTTHIELPQQGAFDVTQVFEKAPAPSGGAARANF